MQDFYLTIQEVVPTNGRRTFVVHGTSNIAFIEVGHLCPTKAEGMEDVKDDGLFTTATVGFTFLLPIEKTSRLVTICHYTDVENILQVGDVLQSTAFVDILV